MPPDTTPSSSTRSLARQLLASTLEEAPSSQVDAVIKVTDRLRLALTKFAGADSFASLLRRSIVLASAEVPALRSVSVGPDGRLQGLPDTSTQPEGEPHDAAVAIAANLLELLNTFIGLPFTVRLIRTAWPDIAIDTNPSRPEEEV